MKLRKALFFHYGCEPLSVAQRHFNISPNDCVPIGKQDLDNWKHAHAMARHRVRDTETSIFKSFYQHSGCRRFVSDLWLS